MSLGFYNTNLPPHLRVLKDEIEGYARAYGLDFFETIFEVIDAEDLNEAAAYGGFPTRYPHWSFGMSFEELRKGYDYGLSKMYEMANHGTRIRQYVEKYGEDEVEAFVDRCMSIDDLIDVHSTAIRRRDPVSRYDFTPEGEESDGDRAMRFKSKDYMDEYINPRKVLLAEEEEKRKVREQQARNFPEHPEKDVLLF